MARGVVAKVSDEVMPGTLGYPKVGAIAAVGVLPSPQVEATTTSWPRAAPKSAITCPGPKLNGIAVRAAVLRRMIVRYRRSLTKSSDRFWPIAGNQRPAAPRQ